MRRPTCVSDLSPETLAAIFESLSVRDPDWATLRPQMGPMALVAVCRAWRKVACETPALWSRFKVDFGHVPPPRRTSQLAHSKQRAISPAPIRSYAEQQRLLQQRVTAQLEAAFSWLERAKPLPLSLTLGSYGDVNYLTTLHPIPDVVGRFADTVGSLRIQTDDDHNIQFLLESVEYENPDPPVHPRLRELVIDHPQPDFEWISMTEPALEAMYPALERFAVSPGFAWHRKDEHLRRICETLALCPALEACHVASLLPDIPGLKKLRAQTTLEALTALTLQLSSGPAFTEFFRLFHMPSLETLSLGYTRGLLSGAMDKPLAKICPTLPETLTQVSFCVPCPAPILIALLKRVGPALTDLRIHYDKPVFDALCAGASSSSDSLAPHLRSLYLLLPAEGKKPEKTDTAPAKLITEYIIENAKQNKLPVAAKDLLLVRETPPRRDNVGSMCAWLAKDVGITVRTGLPEAGYPNRAMVFEVFSYA
ncbi:hypothetical protein MKEN_00154000 [Mycena kentingensis (nom. inval.)]|nr:hypothetical protein MKEN_00154000 [Mycena kentingensis (nom. inval.)]